MHEKRYPVNVRLLGVLHKETSKLYMTSVLWSNHNEIIIYRKLEDFRALHNQLRKKHEPLSLNPLRKSDRIVPRFKAAFVKRGIPRKGFSKSLVRLKPLEEYCMALLSADTRVSQSSELIQFLLPRPDDLKPEFSQNGIVVMPSDESLGRGDRQKADTEVTQPFVTQTYRCIAQYETKDTKNRPFKVEVDEAIEVLIKDKRGWWLVENENKCLAWFPAPYLEKAEADDEAVDEADAESVLYVAAKSYKSANADEISVEIGTVVEVLQRPDNGWWLVRYNSQTGYIPSMYLQPYINPRVPLITTSKEIIGPSQYSALLQLPARNLLTSRQELCRSQFNLLQPSSLADNLSLSDKAKSHSVDVLTEVQDVPPAINVQTVEDSMNRRLSEESNASFSDSRSFSSTESLSDSRTGDIQPSCTPLPNPLSSVNKSNMAFSTLEPNTFKMPSMPKVPPRPQAQEILQRCTTVTRKNAIRNQLPPVVKVVQSC